ncbi:hypothetical protein B0A52_08875 [Exophiala mesophila]|uniref:COX assembly mitochondrial protein n=1 Tax=Exophiala mesophila TaxID=212818 RepID=A0A438MX52_EXOME|nr:hypothetical protein B0A52_08875 [Exophiala mesophila]
MAPPVIPEPRPQTTAPVPSSQPQRNLLNPLPLSASQEAQVRDIYYKRVRSRCADEIKDFAACAAGRTFTIPWTCRAQQFAMNSCMIAHATKAESDAAREEWFAGRMEQKSKRDAEAIEIEKRRAEIIEMTRRQEEKERMEAERTKAQSSTKQSQKRNESPDAISSEQKKGWFWGK